MALGIEIFYIGNYTKRNLSLVQQHQMQRITIMVNKGKIMATTTLIINNNKITRMK